MADVKVVIRTVDQGSEKVQSFGQKLKDVGGAALKLSAAAAAAGVVLKQAFELSQEGAKINQLGESFELMNAQVFKTPDLLENMSAAVRGTIKDTDLMKSLLTLTAGASNEASQAYAAAAPKLLEIAKASNKLNPALGDTAFLFDSLALGIKRGSPLILDNLGITVKVGEANEKYAEQLGKTVEALTAEEKQMALLNAVMESGGVLIDQVGGNVESQADSWARLTVQIGEMTDELKRAAAEGVGPFIASLADDGGFFEKTTGYIAVFNKLREEQEKGNITTMQRIEFVKALALQGVEAADVMEVFEQAEIAATEAMQAFSDASYHQANQTEMSTWIAEQEAIAMAELTEHLRTTTESAGELSGAQAMLNSEMNSGAEAAAYNADRVAYASIRLDELAARGGPAGESLSYIRIKADEMGGAIDRANGHLTKMLGYMDSLDGRRVSANIDISVSGLSQAERAQDLLGGGSGGTKVGGGAKGGNGDVSVAPPPDGTSGSQNVPKFSHGGMVTGGVPGLDSVPALLMPGERVLTRSEAEQWNRGGRGGGNTTINAPITVNVQGGGDPNAIANAINYKLMATMRAKGL